MYVCASICYIPGTSIIILHLKFRVVNHLIQVSIHVVCNAMLLVDVGC